MYKLLLSLSPSPPCIPIPIPTSIPSSVSTMPTPHHHHALTPHPDPHPHTQPLTSVFFHYRMCAPFIEDSDDHLSQLAQLQIFLTLLSSLSLRATPPSPFVSNLVTVILFAVPLLGLALETPLLNVLGQGKAKLGELFAKVFPNIKPPADAKLFKTLSGSASKTQMTESESTKDADLTALAA